ncbi:MAG: hypothetical protein LBF34_00960 [Puniceicoccales bacterium]|jgi:hypothetical protein|nr:hypothetical protein [Puniceicoccales bacterium]
MKTLTFKSKVGLLPVLGILFLAFDSSASTAESKGKVVKIDPSIPVFPSSKMRVADYSNNPTLLRFQTEYRASAMLFYPGTELYEIKREAMKIVMPGNPDYFATIPSRAVMATPPEKVKKDNIELWKGYDFYSCGLALKSAVQCFQYIADYSDLNESIRDRHSALAQVASYFANAFDRLSKSPLSANKIARGLDECFRNNPKANRERGAFYAVDQRLRDELNTAAQALANLPRHVVEIREKEGREAMQFLTPGDPWFLSDNPGVNEFAISPEMARNESIRIWKEYDLSKCHSVLAHVAQCFQHTANRSTCDEIIHSYYNILALIATAFADAFYALQNGSSLLPEEISGILDKWFEDDPRLRRVRSIFYAVDQRLCAAIEEVILADFLV